MKVGRILAVTLALVGLADIAQAHYDRTFDGRIKVWHNTPQRRVQPSWSGDRDEKGYATGTGTLTWFKIQRSWETGSLLPKTKYIQVSQYQGNMVEGKLEGSVTSVDANGNTHHAKFADGERTGDWVAGPARSSRKHAEQEAAAAKVAETPAEAPSPAPKLTEHAAAKQPEKHVASKQAEDTEPSVEMQSAAAANESSTPSESSLQALAKPPSSLRIPATSEPQASAPTVDVGEQPSAKAASSPPPSSPAPVEKSFQNDDARAVAALDSEFHTAVKTNDTNTIERILADDFVLVHGGGQTFSKTDVLKQARDKQVKYERHDVEPGSQKVRVWRDTAVVTETVWVKGAENGRPVDQKVSVTETYVRTPNGWRYVSGQASVPEQ